MKTIIITILSFAVCCYAQQKATVSLNDGGYTISGGIGRPETIVVQMHKGFDGEPISLNEKIAALTQKLHFYELLKRYKINPNKEINAIYADKPLKTILAKLLPHVPVKFDGVDTGVTVGSMAVVKTRLDTVCEHLDAAAGVYFRFTERGIIVTAKPPVQ